jgi:hypothetical protein
MHWPRAALLVIDARPVKQRQIALLGLSSLVLLATGCRGMLPAPHVGSATPAALATVTPRLPRDGVTVYLVTSQEHAGLLQPQVSSNNDARGRHDVIMVVSASQALIINTAGLPGGLPAMRVVDFQPQAGPTGQIGGSTGQATPGSSP